jgi:hypothetical protein
MGSKQDVQYIKVGDPVDVLVKSTGATTAGVVGTTVTAVACRRRRSRRQTLRLLPVRSTRRTACTSPATATTSPTVCGTSRTPAGRCTPSTRDGGQRVLGRQGRLGRLVGTALTAAGEDHVHQPANKVGAAGNKKPDAFLTSRAIQTNLYKQYQSQRRINDAKSVEIDGGYTGINVNLVPVIFDDDCPYTDVFAVKNDGAEVVRADGSGLDGDQGLGCLASQGRLDRRHEGRGVAGVVGLARGARLAAAERIGRAKFVQDDTSVSG